VKRRREERKGRERTREEQKEEEHGRKPAKRAGRES
jgi:hypothetical protein